MIPQSSPQLLWVTGEVAETLRDARIALEEFVERPKHPEAIHRCAELLHQAHGALRVAEVYGASLLADEMEQLALHLDRIAGSGHALAEGLDALSRAIVQLPAYLDRVVTGGRDIPLVLLPLLNDLRAARGVALLSENTLLLLNLPSDQHLLARGARPTPSGEDMVRLARRLRPRYQSALLSWIRGERPDSSLAVIADVAGALEGAAAEVSVYQLWWVIGGVVEGLRQGGLPASAAIKRLLGQVDRQIRRLIDEGEAGPAAEPPVELLNSLLFYVARSTTRGSRISAIRSTFSLGDLLPDHEDLAEARDTLGGPSVALMRTVAGAIREDLGKVKDALDLIARTGKIPAEGLKAQLEMLAKIGDTLGVLGLGDVRDELQSEAGRLHGLLSLSREQAEEELLAVAGALLRVEDRLDAQLVNLVVEHARAEPAAAPETEGEAELRKVGEALLRECLFNMARVRDAISERLAGPLDPQLADSVPELLKGVTAGLLMLEHPRAVAVVERITGHVRRMLEPDAGAMRREALDRLADAIVSLEYFMETVRAGRKDPVFMLENAEACLDALPLLAQGLPEYEPVDVQPGETVTLEERDRRRLLEEPLDFELPEEPPPADAPVPPPPVPTMPAYEGDERPDPELLELFIEEAKELEQTIREHFPAWVGEGNTVELGTARRAFHTLKGSGRMVGARLIGEYAWAIERLMNALLEQRVPRSDALVEFLQGAIGVVPQLIEQIETGRAPDDDIEAWILRANAWAETTPAAGTVEPAAPEVHEMDPVLREIFTREATGHLEVLCDYVASCALRTAPYAVTEAVHRASHTLAGSANMADVVAAVVIARPLNEYLRRLHDDRAGLSGAGLELVKRAVDTIANVVAGLEQGEAPGAPDAVLADEIRALDDDYQLRADAGAVERVPADEGAEAELAGSDPEILAIFCEEAGEILEEAEGAMAAWRASPTAPEPLHALQRHLHTIKGSARLAGVRTIGDFSHDLEHLFEGLADGRRRAEPGLIDVVQECLDSLHDMRDVVAGGRMPVLPEELMARLADAVAGTLPPAVPPLTFEPVAPEIVAPELLEAAPAEVEEESDPTIIAQGIGAMADEEEPTLVAETSLVEQDEPPHEPEAPTSAAAAAAATMPRQELARVEAELLEKLLDHAGEVGIYRSRLEEQLGSVQLNLEELSATFIRLREQLRKMEIETETQIIHRHQGEVGLRGDFDPLELDRYSTIQQLSRALAETASDVASIQQLISERVREAESLIVHQSRAVSELQDGLMRTRLVPFNRHAQRLSRLVRQAAAEYGKHAELQVVGGTAELDRQIMDRMLGPLEHLMRNAVIHGIESPARRAAAGKPENGRVTVSVRREGAEVVMEVSDDGAGIDLEAVRRKATALGLLRPDEEFSDAQAAELILRPGFSTAEQLTQGAGRGVGTDAAASEVRRLGGALDIHNQPGIGVTFEIRLPFTRAITQALVLRAGDEWYALPLPAVEGVVRVPATELPRYLGPHPIPFRYGDDEYAFEHIGALVDGHASPPPESGAVAAILVRAADRPTALLADEMLGAREIVVKPLGLQLSGIRGIAGATILGDGRIVLILDVAALLRARARAPQGSAPRPAPPKEDDRTCVMVVDDSITVRRVTERLLERNGMRVITAKDGVDAVAQLQDHTPDIMLLDIEMPRMDGYEVATHVRSDPRLRHIPIVMITSRAGDKHRARAMSIGVDQYLGKPYQESDLLAAIHGLVRKKPAPAATQASHEGGADGEDCIDD